MWGLIVCRLAGRALVQEALPVARMAVGESQFGFQRDEIGKLHRFLATRAATSPGVAAVSVDIAYAFPSLFRSSVISAVESAAPDPLPAVQAWCGRASQHLIPDPESGGTR